LAIGQAPAGSASSIFPFVKVCYELGADYWQILFN